MQMDANSRGITLLEENQNYQKGLLASQMCNPDFGVAKTMESLKKRQNDRSIAGHDFPKRALRTASTRLQQESARPDGSEDFLVPLRRVPNVLKDS